MPSMTALFRGLAPRTGIAFATGQAAIGTGGVQASASATVSVHIAIPRRKAKLLSLNLIALTAAAGSGAITAQAFRRNNTGTPVNVTLTAASDLTSGQFTTLDKAYSIPITATDANTIFQVNDTLRVDVVAAGTVTTQPQVVIVAEWAILA